MDIPNHAALDLQALFEAVPDLYAVVQPGDDYPIVAVSAAFLQATMSRAEDLVGRNLFEIFRDHAGTPEADGVRDLRAALERVRESRAPEKLDVLSCDLRPLGSTGDGRQERYWRTLLSPVITADGTLRFIICRMEDVTAQVRSERAERKLAEEALRESEERLRMAIESANLGTWDFNPITGELIWSDQTRVMFGLPPDAEVHYQVFLNGVHPDDRERTDAAVQAALRLENEGRYEIDYRTIGLQDGVERWVTARGRAFLNERGQVRRFVGTVLKNCAKRTGARTSFWPCLRMNCATR